jgi:hypothetical protein
MSSGHRSQKKPTDKELDDLLDHALADAKVKKELAKPYTVVRIYDMSYLGGSSIGWRKVYLDQHLRYGPKNGNLNSFGVIPVDGRMLNVQPGLIRHERLEPILENVYDWPYLPLAHHVAQHWEERDYERRGFKPADVEKALRPYIKADAHERIVKVPTDLDMRPMLSAPMDLKLLDRIYTAAQKEKRAHESVAYTNKSAHKGQTCAGCVHYLEPQYYGKPGCAGVKDDIMPGGWCKRFQAGKMDAQTE